MSDEWAGHTPGKVIAALLGLLQEHYVYPDVAAKIESAIRSRQAAGAYRDLAGMAALCRALTEEMQALIDDRHLWLLWHDPPAEGGEAARALDLRAAAAPGQNFGFAKAERLAGNVGMFDIRSFESPLEAGETAAAAMAYVAHTDALILDVCGNPGGDGNMVTMLCTYLFEGIVPLTGHYRRAEKRVWSIWTLPFVPGRRYTTNPVYVLVDGHSFSGAEMLAYDLQRADRAVVVGERTGDAPNAAELFPISERCEALTSVGYPIHPDGGGNWAGGVVPDVACTPGNALAMAHRAALRSILGSDGGRDPVGAQAALARLEAEAHDER